MKLNTSKKLASYVGVALATIAYSSGAIIYTDINPDVILNAPDSSSIYELDLNNDLTLDFIIRLDKYSSSYTSSNFFGQQAYFSVASSATGNYFLKEIAPYSINTSTTGSFVSPVIFNQNNDIKPNDSRWQLPSSIQSNYSSSYGILGAYIKGTDSYSVYRNIKTGKWRNIEDKFVGLKIKVGNDIKVGWVRISVDSLLNSVTIKDYAYGDAGEDVKAGEGTISNISENNTTPIITNNNGIINIQNLSQIKKEFNQINILNLNGQLIKSTEITSEINLKDINSGIYIINFIGNKNTYSQKIKI